MTASDPLDRRLFGAPPQAPFLRALTPLDRRWTRIAVMLLAGPATAMIVGMAVILPVMLVLDHYGYGLTPDPRFHHARLARGAAFLLLTSAGLVGAALGLILAAKMVFRRPVKSWITLAPRFRWGLLGIGFVLSMGGLTVLNLISELLPQTSVSPPAPVLDPAQPLALRAIYAASALGCFLAASWAEEVVFRGYLLQQIGALTRRLWLALLVSAVLFALIHLEFSPAALIARTLLGLAFGWTALRLGGLEFAIGAHAANNLVIALFGDVLLPETPEHQGDVTELAFELAIAVFVVAAAEWTRRRGLGGPISSPA